MRAAAKSAVEGVAAPHELVLQLEAKRRLEEGAALAPAATSVSLRARTPARRDTPFKFSFVGAGMRSTHSSTPSLLSTQHSAAAAASVSSF